MIHTSILLSAALALMPTFTGVLSVTNAAIGNTDIRSAITEKFEENAENNDFSGIIGGRIDFKGLTDEIKSAFAEKRAEAAENGKFAKPFSSCIDFGNLTDEQKAELAEKAANFAENGKPGFGKGIPAKFKANKE